MCLCLVERTGDRVGRGVLVVKVASGVNIHVNIFKSSSIKYFI